jgi:nicotinate dehydrogenase subunit A
MEETIRFKLNGKDVSLTADTDRMLLWVLRTDLEHTGPKAFCGEGFCGACTVLVDGEPVLSCQYPLERVRGKEVITIEGLQSAGTLHPLQEAFLEHNAFQCGFCTSGMILQAYAFLKKNPRPSEAQIAEALEGNLCRCGAYNRIIRAVQAAARAMEGGAS